MQHHRVAEFGRDLAQDVDAFGFEPVEVGQSAVFRWQTEPTSRRLPTPPCPGIAAAGHLAVKGIAARRLPKSWNTACPGSRPPSNSPGVRKQYSADGAHLGRLTRRRMCLRWSGWFQPLPRIQRSRSVLACCGGTRPATRVALSGHVEPAPAPPVLGGDTGRAAVSVWQQDGCSRSANIAAAADIDQSAAHRGCARCRTR